LGVQVTTAPADAHYPDSSGLRARCLQVRLPQKRIALKQFVNQAAVSRWESETRRPAHDLVRAVARVLRVSTVDIENWFAHRPMLGGDTIGRLPGPKRLLHDRGLDVATAADRCGASPVDPSCWVLRQRSVQKCRVPRLVALLDLAEDDFPDPSRSSIVTRKGCYLRELLRRRGLTQSTLGVRLGRSDAAICSWELQRTTASPASTLRLARVLDA